MKILMIAYTFPPLLFPATMCYVKLAKGLHELGHQVTVLAVDPDTFDFPGPWLRDESIGALAPEGVVVHSVQSWERNPLVRLAKQYRPLRELFQSFLEPKKIEWTFAARRYVREHLQSDSIDVILSCSQPHCNHLLGLYLKKWMKKPWVAYFSDPWTDNIYAEYGSNRLFRYHLALETDVMTQADAVYFTSPETQSLVMSKYPKAILQKTDVVTHSYVPEWYGLAPGCDDGRSGGRIRFVQTGHFYGPRTPRPFFEALVRLKKEFSLAERFEFVFFGGMQEEHRRFIEEQGLSDVVSLRGTVPYLETLRVMKNADFLLLIDAPLASPGESVFLPSKLIDYLGGGKPIIGITPLQGASARVLRETGNIVCDIADVAAIVETLAGIAYGSVRVCPDGCAVSAYHYLAVMERLGLSLDRLGGNRSLER